MSELQAAGFGLLIILLLCIGFLAARRKAPPVYAPDLATFLTLLANRGGVVAEEDQLLDDPSYEQALDLGLVSAGGGWSSHVALTGRGRRFLRAHQRVVAERVKSQAPTPPAEAAPPQPADRRKTSTLEKEW